MQGKGINLWEENRRREKRRRRSLLLLAGLTHSPLGSSWKGEIGIVDRALIDLICAETETKTSQLEDDRRRVDEVNTHVQIALERSATHFQEEYGLPGNLIRSHGAFLCCFFCCHASEKPGGNQSVVRGRLFVKPFPFNFLRAERGSGSAI